ncbi:MAG: YeeE/YedE family protein [Acidobacteria bacterium]|nr:YeeE/YedE family protein [Acidobacteriota bacterium]
MNVLRETFEALFLRPLSVWLAALLLATLNILLFAYEKPWTAADGLRNWGDWLVLTLGGPSPPGILPPTLYSGSVLNLGLLLGALASALLSRRFAVRVPPPAELGKGILGGGLMGLGAMLAMGCNVGGFYSALSALSLSGLTMMAGLALGAYVASRYLRWESERRARAQVPPHRTFGAAPATGHSLQPGLGGLCLILIAAAVALYARYGYGQRGGLLLFGVLFGMILQRSRFCFVRAFREPFLSGESEMTRAVALSLAVSVIGFSVLKSNDLRSLDAFVFAAFWQGSLGGGTLFGVGMVLAGGCGVGSLWRAAEGQVKLLCAGITFALVATFARGGLEQAGWLQSLGRAVFLPDWVGWPLALALVLALLASWSLLAAWNEKARLIAAGRVEDTCV